MKIETICKRLAESDTESTTPGKAPAPTTEEITGAQAAKILGCSMARIRQYKADGTLKASQDPEPGSRDSYYKRSDVEALKSKQKGGELPRTGRPEGSKNKETDKKTDKED